MRLSIAALGLASMLALAAAGPAAALTFKGEGLYARFAGANNGKGLVVVDRAGGDMPRLTVGIVGLIASQEYFLTFRSIGCGGTPASANRLFRVEGTTDEHGDLFFITAWGASDIDLKELLSVWINQQTPADWSECARTTRFQNPIIFDSDGSVVALGLTKDHGATWLALLEPRRHGRTRVSVVVNGLPGGDDYRFRLVDEPCGTNGDTLAAVTFSDIVISGFRSVVVGPGGEEIFADKYASFRVRSLAGNNTYCGTTTVFDVKQ